MSYNITHYFMAELNKKSLLQIEKELINENQILEIAKDTLKKKTRSTEMSKLEIKGKRNKIRSCY